MDITVKRFNDLTTAELYEILRCRAEVFVVEQQATYQDLDCHDFSSTHLFIKEGDRILAYMRVVEPGEKFPSASIGRVLTMKDARGHGYARQLLTRAIAIAKTLSPTIEIEAQTYLIDFYQSMGFQPTSDTFILDGLPHISMIHPADK